MVGESHMWAEVLREWGIDEGFELRVPRRGVSRLTRFVDTARGSYVLTLYLPETLMERVRYEHRLLGELSKVGLPFQVPVPVPAASGETVVRVPGSDRVAVLIEVIPGEELNSRDPEQTRALGEALGHLHAGLSAVAKEVELGPAPAWQGVFGAVDRFLAGTVEPRGGLGGSPLTGEQRRRVSAMLEELAEVGPRVYPRGTRELRHGDYNPSNALIAGGRVSGVLDFEVAGPGVRAMDLAHGWYYLWQFAEADPWRPIEAFASGYRSVRRPSEAEVMSVPALTRLYFAASVPMVVGRWRAGEVTKERVRARANQAIALDDFLKVHGERVVEVLGGGP